MSYDSLTSAILQRILYKQQALLRSNTDHSKMKNESVKKSLEKSKNVLEEKRKMVKRKICIKKTHVYNNCYELRSRAINQHYELRSIIIHVSNR